jgi:hypothetical protein
MPVKPLTMQEIFESFDPIDRGAVELPDCDLSRVPWADLEYFAWRHPSGHRAYLCTSLPERNVGLVLRLHGGASRVSAGLCDLCVAIDRESGTTVAMVDSWSRPRSSYGLHICSDLDCSRAVRRLKAMDCMGETITTGQRSERLRGNLERFLRAVTGLGASGRLSGGGLASR